jgi:hypothetical protein
MKLARRSRGIPRRKPEKAVLIIRTVDSMESEYIILEVERLTGEFQTEQRSRATSHIYLSLAVVGN